MQVLVLTTQLFAAPARGGERCTARLLQALLDEGAALQVLGRGDAPPARGALRHTSLGPTPPPFAEMAPVRRVATLAGALARGRAWTVQGWLGGGAATHTAQALQAALVRADLIVVDHLQAWPLLQALARPGSRLPPRLLQAHNHESVGYRVAAEKRAPGPSRWLLQREARRLAVLEQQAWAGSAAWACLSDADLQAMQAQLAGHGGPAPALEVLGGWADAVGRPPPQPAARRRIGAIGTWTWAPNRQGLDWLLQQVWPRLAADAELVLAGHGLEQVPLPPGVRCLGRVADPSLFYDQVDTVVVPALGGSGVQEKAIEAIASGRAVVATDVALRGLAPLPPNVRSAVTAEDFASACLRAPLQPEPGWAAAVVAWNDTRRQHYRAALRRCVAAADRSRLP